MNASCLWVLFTVLFAVGPMCNCQFSSVSRKSHGEGSPQKMIEIIKLMLSENSGADEKHQFEIQKVDQQESPNYEILITPNKHFQEVKGSQKIKIYVEAANENGKSDSPGQKSEQSTSNEKQNISDVLPLSIESRQGTNINYHRQIESLTGKHNFNKKQQDDRDEDPSKDFESFHSKRQTDWSSHQKLRTESVLLNRSPEIKEPSYVDQNNPYHMVSVPRNGEPRDAPVYNSEYSSVAGSSGSTSGKRVSQAAYVDDYSERGNPQTRFTQVRLPGTEYQTNYDRRYMEDTYEIKPSTAQQRPIDTSTHVRLGERPGEQSTRQTNERGTNHDLDEDYGISGSKSTPYSREPESQGQSYEVDSEYNVGSNARPANGRYPNYEKVGSEGRPGFPRPSGEGPFYERESVIKGQLDSAADNSRPVRENNSGYSGFPESYQPDISHHYSRPLQYEPARAFPASPCLTVFKYEGREPEEDRWFADIYVSTDEVLNGMRLDITLDRPAELLTNWLADVKTKDNEHFTLLSLTHKLVPGPAETVRIMVKFNGKKTVPYLKSINLNGRLICPTNRAQKTTTRRPVYENPGDLQLKRTTELYIEATKRPSSYIDEYDSNTKRTTAHVERRTTPPYEEMRKPTLRPPTSYLKPNPNGYDETDQNSFGPPPKKPPGRPAHSNGKPPPHAAKPALGVGHGQGQFHGQGQGQNQGYGHGQGQSSSNKGGNKNPGSVTGSKPNKPSSQDSQRGIQCGTPSIQPSPLITHGQHTSRGQWPWHVALYKNVGTDLTFFCGGSLINNKYVLTAAHCVTKTYTTQPLDENTLVVYLGKYHLKLWSEGGVQNRQVSKVYVHSKYNSTDFRSDIAVLALSTPVEYTDYVRPICMWDKSNTRIEEVEGQLGTVVGWGFDEYKMLTEELRQAKMPVVEQKTCLWSYPDFYPQFTSNMTYCAGFKNGTSVCNGDSGGGMVFPYKDNNGVERWYLRGIVSISPARNDSRVCDTSHYVVFTDVAKYLPWLDNFI